MNTLQNITQLILDGNTAQARLELNADKEMSRISAKHVSLSAIVRRDLLESINETEINR